jgi:hypothetical protein
MILFGSSLMLNAYAHQIDSVGDYRIEIGWVREPAVSGESNGIEVFVSRLDPNFPPDEQEFKEGIEGLSKTLKIQLVRSGEHLTLPLFADHDIPGKYYTLVTPMLGGHYQVNIKGKIEETNANLALHAPKVENRTRTEFPKISDKIEIYKSQVEEIEESIKNLRNDVTELKSKASDLSGYYVISYIGIGFGIAGIVIALTFSRRK